jgi:hypothetical protein
VSDKLGTVEYDLCSGRGSWQLTRYPSSIRLLWNLSWKPLLTFMDQSFSFDCWYFLRFFVGLWDEDHIHSKCHSYSVCQILE